MIDDAVVALRLVQYLTGSILFGSALFLVYALPREVPAQGWPRPLLAGSAAALSVAALAGFLAQTIAMAGSVELGLTEDSLQAAIDMSLGKAALVRAGAAAAAVPLLLFMRRGRTLWALTSLLGFVAVATFAWMGHGAATEGAGAQLHFWADLIHAVLAAMWVGALVGFVMLLLDRHDAPGLHRALTRFSSLGVPLVALLTATGLVNAWYLVGLPNLGSLISTQYGRLLSLKLALFALMLVLAGLNRWRHTPAVPREGLPSPALRASMIAEASLGILVLALVAWFGMLEPPAS